MTGHPPNGAPVPESEDSRVQTGQERRVQFVGWVWAQAMRGRMNERSCTGVLDLKRRFWASFLGRAGSRASIVTASESGSLAMMSTVTSLRTL